MKSNFLIFGGDTHYARGGGHDLIGRSATLEEAQGIAYRLLHMQRNVDYIRIKLDWTHVFSVATGKVVEQFGTRPFGSDPEDAPEDDKV